MLEDISFNSVELSIPNFEQSEDNKIFTTNIETINNDYFYNHYFCIKCLKFPFIKFCKNRKHIRLTCSCFNNIKISIEEFLKKNDIQLFYQNLI